MPTISIIVPVYKVESFLHRCVDSILCQTFDDFELILVDDGSPDRSGEICDDYALRDQRVRVIHKENGGLSSARNAGISIARGDYLSFVDSDDVIHPRMQEFLIKSIKNWDADFVSTRYVAFSTDVLDMEKIDRVEDFVLLREDFLEQLYPKYFEQIGISAWGKLYKRKLFEQIRYPEGKIYEDLHIYLKLLQQCQRIVVLDKPLYYYYLGNVSITKSNYLAYNRFDEFIVRLGYADFFSRHGLIQQYYYAINDYLTFFFRNAFAVLLKYQEKSDEIKPYMKQHRVLLKEIVHNPYVCKMRKLCAVLIHVSPALAAAVAKRCIPECLLEEMR